MVDFGVIRVIGALLVAYGPSAAILLRFVARPGRSLLLIMFVASAFFWLLSVLLASLLWLAIPPLKDVHAFTIPISVMIQEGFRYGLLKLYDKYGCCPPSISFVAHPSTCTHNTFPLCRAERQLKILFPQQHMYVLNDVGSSIGEPMLVWIEVVGVCCLETSLC
jgi:hypothetical protein